MYLVLSCDAWVYPPSPYAWPRSLCDHVSTSLPEPFRVSLPCVTLIRAPWPWCALPRCALPLPLCLAPCAYLGKPMRAGRWGDAAGKNLEALTAGRVARGAVRACAGNFRAGAQGAHSVRDGEFDQQPLRHRALTTNSILVAAGSRFFDFAPDKRADE